VAFCPNCGSQVAGTFCPNCGTQVSGTTGGTTSGTTSGASGGAYSSVPPTASAAGLTENVASALCYLFGFITGIIFLVIAPYNQNRNIRFHAFQSIFLNVAWFAFSIFVAILGTVTHGLGFILSPLVWLLFVLLWLYMMFSAYNNKKVKLPVIGDLAEKQA
jgi:uncharacterized membrane protein